MTYFRLTFNDATLTTSSVWACQEARGERRSAFHLSADGPDCSVWTKDPEGERLFRETLAALGFTAEESDTQQVVTELDGWFA